MNTNIDWFLQHIVHPTLRDLERDIEPLALFLTAVAQSPSNDEPVFGIYGISHEQHWRVWDDFLAKTPALASTVRGLAGQHRFLNDPDAELNLNNGYATAIAALLMEQQADQPIETFSSFDDLLALWLKNGGNQSPKHIETAYRRLLGQQAA